MAQFPVIKVSQIPHSLSLKDKIQVVHACYLRNLLFNKFPTVTSSCAWHLQFCQYLPFQSVKTYLHDNISIVGRRQARRIREGAFSPKSTSRTLV